jgi:hypothetical protein
VTPHPHPTRHHLTAHPERDAAADHRQRRNSSLRQHPTARAQRPSGPAFPGGPALHRQPPRGNRTAPRTPNHCGARPSRQYIPGLTAEPAWPTLRAHLLALAAETGEHPLRHMLTSPTSPTKFTTTPGKLPPSQSGHYREATSTPLLSATSPCGGPPTASIPETHGQPEEPHSKHLQPCGNNVPTGTSPISPIRHSARGPTSDRQNAPPLAGSARTKDPNGVRAGRPRPADSTQTAVVRTRHSGHEVARQGDGGGRTGKIAAHCRIWLSQIKASAPRPHGACPRFAAGRAAC